MKFYIIKKNLKPGNDSFIDSYASGETPIPCVQCNQTVKFKDLFQYAKNLKADALITDIMFQGLKKMAMQACIELRIIIETRAIFYSTQLKNNLIF